MPRRMTTVEPCGLKVLARSFLEKVIPPGICLNRRGDYICTCLRGHDGPHIAHNASGRGAYASWPQVKESN